MNETLLQVLVFSSIMSFVIYFVVRREESRRWVGSFFTIDRSILKQRLRDLDGKLTILDRYMGVVKGAGSRITPLDLLIRIIICTAFCGVAAYIVTSYIPMGIAGMIGGIFVPYLIYARLRSKRKSEMEKLMSPMLKQFALYLRAGLSKIQAVSRLAENTPDPLGQVLGDILAKVNTGVPLTEAFQSEISRVPLYEFKLLVVLIIIHSEMGGELAESLENLSDVMDAKKKLTSKIDSITGESKMSAYVMAIAPTSIFILLRLYSPQYYEQMNKFEAGKLGVMISFMLIALGVFLVRKMSAVDVDKFYK